VEVIAADVTYRHDYDPRTSAPLPSADHFRRHVMKARSRRST
jgi:hypothetical protein